MLLTIITAVNLEVLEWGHQEGLGLKENVFLRTCRLCFLEEGVSYKRVERSEHVSWPLLRVHYNELYFGARVNSAGGLRDNLV